jgi:selenocysteine lyase/cysteine desulfurase
MFSINRRNFLGTLAAAAGSVRTFAAHAAGGAADAAAPADLSSTTSWEDVRSLFELRPDRIHMAGLLFASHPLPVRNAIARHREELQRDPASYISHERWRLEGEVLQSASRYLGVKPADLALTDSTSMGLGLLYSGLKLSPRDEILTTTHDHYATEAAIAVCAERTQCTVKRIDLYPQAAGATADAMVDALTRAITPSTRIVALTWVHSGTGVKAPVRAIADAIARENTRRGSQRRIYLCVDGVHGLGIENVTLPELGCDFFAAGTHKWMFGPRGTGVLWGRSDAWAVTRSAIPTWEPGVFYSTIGWRERPEIGGGQLMTPGGYHAFDHTWALDSAFDMHASLGKDRIATRVHVLCRQMKEGLRAMRQVRLHTPMDEALSSGIVCFEVDGMAPDKVVAALAERGVIASRTPYRTPYARLCPGLLTPGNDVEKTLEAVRALL